MSVPFRCRTVSIVFVASMFIRVTCDNTRWIQWLVANSNITDSAAHNHQRSVSHDCAQGPSHKSAGLWLIQIGRWRRLVSLSIYLYRTHPYASHLHIYHIIRQSNHFINFPLLSSICQKPCWWTRTVRRKPDWRHAANHVCSHINASMRKSPGQPPQQHFNRIFICHGYFNWFITFHNSNKTLASTKWIFFCCSWAGCTTHTHAHTLTFTNQKL